MADIKLTNEQVLALCKESPSYKRWTSKLTNEIFTAAGFEEIELHDPEILEDFFKLSVRIVLNKIAYVNAKIPTTYKAIVEEFDTEKGGILQRITIHPIKPVSPAYRGLEEGGSVDPFIIRKPKTDERFYRMNFDYQNFITLQEINLKQMFLSQDGIFTYVEGITKAFNDAYYIQKYETMRQMLHNMINSTKFPLLETQKYNGGTNEDLVNIDSDVSAEAQAAYREFINIIDNIASFMDATPMANSLNSKKFMHGMNREDYVLLIRYTIYNLIKKYEGVIVGGTGYIKEVLERIPFKVELVEDFGGIYYVKASDNTPLLPVYNIKTGEALGFNENGGVYNPQDPSDTNAPLPEEEIKAVDPNSDVFAVLAQRGIIFATKQNPYQIKSIYNPRGEYTNHFASQPNGAFNYDATYDMIVFSKGVENNKKKFKNNNKNNNKNNTETTEPIEKTEQTE